MPLTPGTPLPLTGSSGSITSHPGSDVVTGDLISYLTRRAGRGYRGSVSIFVVLFSVLGRTMDCLYPSAHDVNSTVPENTNLKES